MNSMEKREEEKGEKKLARDSAEEIEEISDSNGNSALNSMEKREKETREKELFSDSAIQLYTSEEIEEISDSNRNSAMNSMEIQQFIEENEEYEEIMEEIEIYEHNEQMSESRRMVSASSDAESRTVPLEASLVGVTRNTLKEMHDLYCEHGKLVGFSVRKGKNRESPHDKKLILEKYYLCSCAGKKMKNDEDIILDGNKKRKTLHTRTQCEALLRVKMNEDGVYEVVKHCLDHNHELIRPEMGHLLRSSRQIKEVTVAVIQGMDASGLKPSQSYRFMAQEAGGAQKLGHTYRDHLNFIGRWKVNAIEGGDAENMYEMLQERAREEVDFFYRVKMDEIGRLTHIFWRDSMMREDYDIFGDIVVFDTTYRTNKYNLICAPFVGVNHHWKNVMYGCAFLSDEKIESFEWLFNTFKKSMGQKPPTTVFTDQDHAISAALEKVFPQTRHRLCLWHLQQNAVKGYAKFKSDIKFKAAFKKCLLGCVDQEDFEKSWDEMTTEYNLKSNPWFSRLYELREKWCTALNKDYFSAGLLSSQRSESTNSTISFKAKKTTSLTDFFIIFSKVVKDWRETEMNDEFQCSRAKPDSTLRITGMLEHAAEVYTLTIFRLFEKEFTEVVSNTSDLIYVDGTLMIYEVKNHGQEFKYQVIYDHQSRLISCSCKKYEEAGLLCNHSLRVMLINSVQRIPDIYIKRRWTKAAKVEIWNKSIVASSSEKNLTDCIPWRTHISRMVYNTILKSQDTSEARKIVEDACLKMDMDVTTLLNSLKANVQPQSSSDSILDPARAITKGRRQRMKGHFEKKNSSNKSSSTVPREIGSKTPNLHLI